jgi:hypothetical protein
MLSARFLTIVIALILLPLAVRAKPIPAPEGESNAAAQTTEFPYEGFITDANDAPANGNFDFEFRLFGDLNGGIAVGALRRPNVTVTDGVFSVILDFGSFPAANRFLEIGFRPVGVGPLTTLAPRVQLLSVPYSTRANEAEHASTAANAVNAQNAEQAVNARDAANARHADHAHTAQNALRLGDTPAKDFVRRDDPRLSDPRSPLPGSAAYIQNGATQQASSSFNISGNGTAGGTLTGNVVSAATHFSIGIAPVLVTTGFFNFFAGILAGGNNTTGRNNSFFGTFAGSFNTTGSNNSYFGSSAGRNNNTGSDNSYFGESAGVANTEGSANAFFGTEAGRTNTSGSDNAFFGKGAGRHATASRNSFFGSLAGHLNTNGEDNALFGYGAGEDNTTGDKNAFFGSSAGSSNTEGRGNAFVGAGAGDSNTSGDDNTFVGVDAGNGITTGTRNTLIGAAANVDDGDLTNATAIGSRALVTTSHALVLGSIGGVNGALFDTSVGIGTTAPLDRLHVNGVVRVGSLGAGGSTTVCRNASQQISTCASSLRYKVDVAPFRPGLELASKLQPIVFTWKDSGMRDIGLGAEDVAKIEPLFVSYDNLGAVEGVKYDRIAVVLLNAIKEQKAQIERLTEELRNQRSLFEGLQKVVCRDKPRIAECWTSGEHAK